MLVISYIIKNNKEIKQTFLFLLLNKDGKLTWPKFSRVKTAFLDFSLNMIIAMSSCSADLIIFDLVNIADYFTIGQFNFVSF